MGVDLAWQLAATALAPAIVYSSPTGVYDATADTTATTWGSVTPDLLALVWDEQEIQAEDKPSFPGCTHKAKMMFRQSDLAVAPTSASEIDVGAVPVRWRATLVETPPAQAIYIVDVVR